MRYMMIVKSDEQTEQGTLPDAEFFAEMARYNEKLTKACCLLSAEGLAPTAKGFRVRLTNGEREVRNGPFPGARDQIAGFWLIDVDSREEAIEWASQCPVVRLGGELELREVMEMTDLPADVQTAAEESPGIHLLEEDGRPHAQA
ncbi:MAG: YciI family protein [Candidatus Coatesbacteria bacterium]